MRTINLIPREGKRASEARNRLVLWIGLGVLYVLLLGAVTVWRSGAVDDAQDELDAQLLTNQQLEAEVRSLSSAENVRNDFEASQALLIQALANDVSWGRLVNDLGRLIPDRVWISSYTGNSGPAATGASIGELSFAGTAFAPPDVAAWLRVLDSDRFPGVLGTWVSNITANEISDVPVVAFGSTTSLTPDALSERGFDRIPEIS